MNEIDLLASKMARALRDLEIYRRGKFFIARFGRRRYFVVEDTGNDNATIHGRFASRMVAVFKIKELSQCAS
jgi:hypothetical protein